MKDIMKRLLMLMCLLQAGAIMSMENTTTPVTEYNFDFKGTCQPVIEGEIDKGFLPINTNQGEILINVDKIDPDNYRLEYNIYNKKLFITVDAKGDNETTKVIHLVFEDVSDVSSLMRRIKVQKFIAAIKKIINDKTPKEEQK